MARPDAHALRQAAQAVPADGLRLRGLLALAPGGRLPLTIVLCTLPAALPGLQLGWVCVPVLLYLAAALWRGDRHPPLPARFSEALVSQAAAVRLLHGCAWLVERAGRYLRCTWPALVRRTRRKPAAALVAAMALVILLPLPGSNLVPALSIVALMGGLAWRDGRAVLAALLLAGVSVALVAALAGTAWALASAWV